MELSLCKIGTKLFKTWKHAVVFALSVVLLASGAGFAYAALSQTPDLQISITDRSGDSHVIMSWYYDDETGQYYDENGKSLSELGLIDSACSDSTPYNYSGVWKPNNGGVAYATATSAVKVSDLLSYCAKIDTTASEIISSNSSSVELKFQGWEATSEEKITAWDLYGGIADWNETRYYNKDSAYNAKAGVEVPTVLALKSVYEKNASAAPDASKADRSSGIRLLQGQNAKVTSNSTAIQYANMWINQGAAPSSTIEGSLPNVAKIEITPTYYPVNVANGTKQGDEGEEGYSSKVLGATVTPDDHYFSSLADLSYGFNVTVDNSYELHSVYFNGAQLTADSVTDNIYHFTAKIQAIDKGNKLVVNTRRSEGSPQGTLYLEDVTGGTLSIKSGGASLTNGSAIEEGMVLELSFTLKTGYEFNNFTVKGQDWLDDTNTYTVTAADCALEGGLHVGAKTTAKKAKVILTSQGIRQYVKPGSGGWNRINQDLYGNIAATYTDPDTGASVDVESGSMVPVGVELKITISAPNGYTPSNFWKVSTTQSGSVSCAFGPSMSTYEHTYMDKTRTATYTTTADDSELASIEFVACYQMAKTYLTALSDSNMGSLALYRNTTTSTDSYPVISGKSSNSSININVNIQFVATPKPGYKVDHFYYYAKAYSSADTATQTKTIDADLYTQDKYQGSLYVDGDFIEENGHYLYIGVEWAKDTDTVEVVTNNQEHVDFACTAGGVRPVSYTNIPAASEIGFSAKCDAGYALSSVTIKEYRKKSADSDELNEKSYTCTPTSTFKLKTNTTKIEVTPNVISSKAVTLTLPSTEQAHACGFDYTLTYNLVEYKASIQRYSEETATIFDTSKDEVGTSVQVYQGYQLHLKAVPLSGAEPEDKTQQYLDSFTYLFTTSLSSKYGIDSAVVSGNEVNFKAAITHETEDITWDRIADTSWYNADKNSFEISTTAQLAGLSVLVNSGTSFEGKTINLISDIDTYGDASVEKARFFVSIGSQANPFKGTFNGLGHSIKLYSSSKHSSVGLFGYCEGATIQNLTVTGEIARYYEETQSMGAIVGTMNGGTISNCTNEANISSKQINTGSQYFVGCGGIVGLVTGADANIEKCQNYGNLSIAMSNSSSAWYAYAGGIVGLSKDVDLINIEACANYGTVESTSSVRCGGILGAACFSTADQKANIRNSYNLGTISFGSCTAEIVGALRLANKATDDFACGNLLIDSCYCAGCTKSYSGTSNLGSFLGGIEPYSMEEKTRLVNIEIKNSYYRNDNSKLYADTSATEETTAYEIAALGEYISTFNDCVNWIVPAKADSVVALDALKDYASKLGTAYCKDTYGLNVSYGNTPILTWQVPGTSSIFVRESANGKVTSSLNTADKGTKVYLDVQADEGYKLASLNVTDADGKSVDLITEQEGTRYSFEMPSSLALVSATFAPLYSVTLGEDIQNGTLAVDAQEAIAGQVVTVTVKPKDYCVLQTIECVTDDAKNVELKIIDDGLTYSFVMPENNVTLAATFEKVFSVIVKSAENGSISVNRTGAREGNTIYITFTPDSGYVLESVKIRDLKNNKYVAEQQEDGTYAFTMPASNVQISATFVKEQVAPEPTPTPAGKVSVAKAKLKFAKSLKKAKLTLKWNKISGVSGYQIYYKQAGKKVKYKKVGASKKTITLSKLLKGKKCKVKIRAYKTVGGKTYFGKWSSAKNVKIKKK